MRNMAPLSSHKNHIWLTQTQQQLQLLTKHTSLCIILTALTAVLSWISSSTGLKKEPFVITGAGLFTSCNPFVSLNQQCESIKQHPKHQLQPGKNHCWSGFSCSRSIKCRPLTLVLIMHDIDYCLVHYRIRKSTNTKMLKMFWKHT